MEVKEKSTAGNTLDTKIKPVKYHKKKPMILIIVIAVVILAAITAGVLLYLQKQHDETVRKAVHIDTYYQGIVVQDVALGGKTKEEAKALLTEVEPTLRDKIEVSAVYEDKTYTYTEDDFVFTYNTDEVLEKAYQVAREGTDEERYEQILKLQETPEHFSIDHQFQTDNLPEIAASIAAELNFEPVNASVSDFHPEQETMFSYKEGKAGLKVDEETLVSDMQALLDGEKQGSVAIKTQSIPFKVTAAQLKEDTELLSSYSTVSTNKAEGNHNMALALAAANGKTLKPGEVFSFNGATGNTNNGSRGYKKAGAINNGKLEDAYGGGICQASTTIYGAVLRADLKVVQRNNHSWPSTYVPIGQDASVSYPSGDFKFQNNTNYPIYIKASMSGKTLTVKIYGVKSTEWDTIDVVSQKTETIQPGPTTYKDDPSLPAGKQVEDIKSRQGFRAVGSKIYYKNGKEVRREAIAASYYRPIAGVIKVGTGAAQGQEPTAPDPTVPAE